MSTPSRNNPCPCGSGRKYKNCCFGKDAAIQQLPAPANDQLLRVALQHHQAGRLLDADSYYQAILRSAPNHPEALHLSGLIAYQTGKYPLAIELIGNAINIKPSAQMHYNLGNVFREQGNLDAAVECFRRAVSIKPDYTQAYNNLGIVYQAQGVMAAAAESYRKALSLKPDYAEAHNNLGIVLRAQGEPDAAAESYRMALAFKPNYAEAHYGLGNAFHEQGRLDEAVFHYRQALSLKPNDAEIYNSLGIVLQKQRKIDEAINCYRSALSLHPDYADAFGNLGGALRAQGHLDEALACFQQVIRLMPGNDMAQHQIASLTGNNTERAPAQYVESVFDDYADKFDAHLQQGLKYDIPQKMAALIAQHSTPSAAKWDVLDLGCGTGLAGLAFAPFARRLVGVDLSTKMLEKARERNVYQRLEHSDLITMLRGEADSSYDVIIAADVFVYLGKLDEIVGEIKRLLRPGGVFTFSVEAAEAPSNEKPEQSDQQEYRLEITGRYTHASGYINRLAASNDFLVRDMAETQIRVERERPVNGYLVLWQR